MSWVCLEDRRPITARGESLHCPHCDAEYAMEGGVPVFVRDAADRASAGRDIPLLDGLWREMQTRSGDEAATDFCEAHGCSRTPHAADWKFFFSVPRRGHLLELGSGFGDDLLALHDVAGRTTSLVPTLAHGRILRRRLDEAGRELAAVAVTPELRRLPLPDGSVDAIAMEEVAAAGFGLGSGGFAAVAAEWSRVLAPDGVIVLTFGNPLYRLPGVRSLVARIRSREHADSLNRMVKAAGLEGSAHGPSLRVARRRLRALGFRTSAVYAPLPDERDTRIVVPVDDARVIGYFLHNLVRKNSPAVRLAVRLADLAARLGFFDRLVPHYFLTFRRSEASEAADA